MVSTAVFCRGTADPGAEGRVVTGCGAKLCMLCCHASLCSCERCTGVRPLACAAGPDTRRGAVKRRKCKEEGGSGSRHGVFKAQICFWTLSCV